MDSKGDVKHFFGVRFAWHVPESCCCSSVSQLRLQGISANGSACSRGQKIVVLWIPKVTWSTFSACVLLGMCPNPAAVRVFRNCASKGFLLMVLLAREDKRLLFYGFQRWREALFRRAFCLACARILLLFECFATALQGISANGSACSWSTFSACVLLGMCPNPAAVRVFRNCASKGFLLMVALCSRGQKIVVFARILLLFECFATAPPRDFC